MTRVALDTNVLAYLGVNKGKLTRTLTDDDGLSADGRAGRNEVWRRLVDRLRANAGN